jgi:hypothetical protein
VEEHRVTHFFDGLSGQKYDLNRFQRFSKTEITDLEHLPSKAYWSFPPK